MKNIIIIIVILGAFYLGAKNPGWLAKVPVIGG